MEKNIDFCAIINEQEQDLQFLTDVVKMQSDQIVYLSTLLQRAMVKLTVLQNATNPCNN